MSRRSNNLLAIGDQNNYASHQASAQVIKLVYSDYRELSGPNRGQPKRGGGNKKSSIFVL